MLAIPLDNLVLAKFVLVNIPCWWRIIAFHWSSRVCSPEQTLQGQDYQVELQASQGFRTEQVL
jgi:hypothetical protein